MFRRIAAAALVMVASASYASAQTVYEPVQYQYGEGCHRYYYGGSDPAVFSLAERQRALNELSDHRPGSYRHTHAYLHYRLIGRLDSVYSDVAPYMNARVFGYLPVDAANDAYAAVPRYFRKGDLMAAAVTASDGSRVVAAQARPVETPRPARDEAAQTQPVRPRAIIIIPRGRPVPAAPNASDKPLQVSAR